jgi:hypothetical protein
MKREWAAGVWEQNIGLLVWSNHSTEELAIRAAYRYSRRQSKSGPRTGGMLSWSGGVKGPDGKVRWFSWAAKQRGEVQS